MCKNPQRFRFQSCSFPVKPLLKLSFYYSCFASLALHFAERNTAIKAQDYHLCRLGCAKCGTRVICQVCSSHSPARKSSFCLSDLPFLTVATPGNQLNLLLVTKNIFQHVSKSLEQSTSHLLSLLSVFSPQLLPHGREVTLANMCNVNILYTKQSNSGNLSVTL